MQTLSIPMGHFLHVVLFLCGTSSQQFMQEFSIEGSTKCLRGNFSRACKPKMLGNFSKICINKNEMFLEKYEKHVSFEEKFNFSRAMREN